MQITHEEAHALIHLKADNALQTNKQKLLAEHLHGCAKCNAYADEVKDIEEILHSTMQKHWNRPAPPIQYDVIKARKDILQRVQALLTTRYAVMGTALLFVGFAMWQFISSTARPASPMMLDVSPIPTPSRYSTSTKQLSCEQIQYQVRPDDTLESIALQFSVSKETIIDANNLRSISINGLTQLTIPICSPTATGTTHPPTFTTTPFTETITYTPG